MSLDVTIDQDVLRVGPDFAVSFQRTLRIPDDGCEYPLPPGLGRFPLRRHDGELLLPIHQREALRLSFEGMPHAVKVAIGGIDALTGGFWDPTCLFTDPQDYLVSGHQPRLDGVNAGDGSIRQFVAEAMGDLQLLVVPPMPGCFPDESARRPIHLDEHGLDTWDIERATVVEVRLCNSDAWTELTGEVPPATLIDAATYTKFGLPWFERYAEGRDIAPSRKLAGVRSIDAGCDPPLTGLKVEQLFSWLRDDA